MHVCLSMCLSVHPCVCVHDNSKNKKWSINLKLEHIKVYENSPDKFGLPNQGQGHRATLKFFLSLPQYKVSSPKCQLWQR